VERNVGGRFEWTRVGEAEVAWGGADLEMGVPWTVLGLAGPPARLDFKWADAIGSTGEASDFTLNGDVAPNDRFNYRARWW